MKADALLSDPVFQLNLLLWMAKDQPDGAYRVRPLFREHGFAIVYIEQPFAFPPEMTNALQTSGLDISVRPEPELVLARQASDRKALYFEAKSHGFSPHSGGNNCRQARGHLAATGPVFGDVFKPLTECLLCYVVPACDQNDMAQTLKALANELSIARLDCGRVSIHGLFRNGTDLIYGLDNEYAAHVGTSDLSIVVMSNLEENTDPIPLLLVFSDEDCPNQEMADFYRSAVLSQVRAALLCDLHTLNVHQSSTTSADDLLHETTGGMFRFMGRQRQKALRRLVHRNVLVAIASYWKTRQPGNISLSQDGLSIKWATPKDKAAFLDWLEDRQTTFDVTRPPSDVLPLFDAPTGENDEES